MAATATINNVHNSSPSPIAGVDQSGPSNMPLIPFAASAKPHWEQGATQNVANTAWASGQNLTFQIPTNGYMRAVWLTVTGASGAKGASAVVAPAPDAPWNLFTNAQLQDVSGTPIWNLDGYAWFLARLLGGYKNFRPDQSAFGYTSVDGTANGGLGTGNFKVKYETYTEFGQHGLGCLPNMSSSGQYRLNLTLNGPAQFYNGASQQPGTLPNLSALLELNSRMRPQAQDAYGNPQQTDPPQVAVQYWTSQTFTVNNGANTIQFTRVGNTVRNHILIFRDANGSRANADATGVTPTTIEFDWDAIIRYKANVDTIRQENYEAYGFDIPSGVLAFQNTDDPEGLPGHEYGYMYIPTTGSTLLKLQFSTSAAGTLQVLTNDIVFS